MVILTKEMSGGFKDVSAKEGIVTGYLNAFNVKDSDGDITIKGCFSKSISENGPQGKKRIKYLLDHDRRNAVGVFLKLFEDEFGLGYEAKIGSHTSGKDFLQMVEDKIITEHSIGYSVLKWERDEIVDATKLLDVKLYEGSGLQFWGANEYTPITGVKSEADLLVLFESLEKALKNGNYSDDTFKNIIIPKHNAISELFKGTSTKPEHKDVTTLPGLEQIKEAFKESFIF